MYGQKSPLSWVRGLIQFASRAFEQNDVARIAEPEMKLLCSLTKETCHLAIRCGNEMVLRFKTGQPANNSIAQLGWESCADACQRNWQMLNGPSSSGRPRGVGKIS